MLQLTKSQKENTSITTRSGQFITTSWAMRMIKTVEQDPNCLLMIYKSHLFIYLLMQSCAWIYSHIFKMFYLLVLIVWEEFVNEYVGYQNAHQYWRFLNEHFIPRAKNSSTIPRFSTRHHTFLQVDKYRLTLQINNIQNSRSKKAGGRPRHPKFFPRQYWFGYEVSSTTYTTHVAYVIKESISIAFLFVGNIFQMWTKGS